MAIFEPTTMVRLSDAIDHAVAHRVATQDRAAVTTRCGWSPPTRGVVMRLSDAIVAHSAFVCVRCFK